MYRKARANAHGSVGVLARAGDGASQAKDLAGQHPPDETDGELALVVGRNGDVDKVERSIGVGESDDGDVDVRRLSNRLVVDARIGDDDQPRFAEGASNIVGKRARGEATGDGLSTGCGGEFENGSVTVRTSGDDDDVARVLDGGDDSSGEDELLPSLADVDHVDAIRSTFEDVGQHSLRSRSALVFAANPTATYLVGIARAKVARGLHV